MSTLFLSTWALTTISRIQSWANHFVTAASTVCETRTDQFLMAASDSDGKKPAAGHPTARLSPTDFPTYEDLLPPSPFTRPDEFLREWGALPGWVTLGMAQNMRLVAQRPDAVQVLRKIVNRCRQGVTLTQVRHAALAVSNFVRQEGPKKEVAAARVGDKLFTSGKEEPTVWDQTTLSGLVEWSGPTPKGVTLYLKTPIS